MNEIENAAQNGTPVTEQIHESKFFRDQKLQSSAKLCNNL